MNQFMILISVQIHLAHLRDIYTDFSLQYDVEEISFIIVTEYGCVSWDKGMFHNLKNVRVRVLVFHNVAHKLEFSEVLSHVLYVRWITLGSLQTLSDLFQGQWS